MWGPNSFQVIIGCAWTLLELKDKNEILITCETKWHWRWSSCVAQMKQNHFKRSWLLFKGDVIDVTVGNRFEPRRPRDVYAARGLHPVTRVRIRELLLKKGGMLEKITSICIGESLVTVRTLGLMIVAHVSVSKWSWGPLLRALSKKCSQTCCHSNAYAYLEIDPRTTMNCTTYYHEFSGKTLDMTKYVLWQDVNLQSVIRSLHCTVVSFCIWGQTCLKLNKVIGSLFS